MFVLLEEIQDTKEAHKKGTKFTLYVVEGLLDEVT
jgi:hypothetical protein